MAVIYVGGALFILLSNLGNVPASFALIVEQAFRPTSMVGGAAGSFLMTMMWGIRRGLFSNEAGQGSAPIAHATAKTDEPVREGLVASLEPFIDTLVICTMTGLVIVTTGAWLDSAPRTFALAEVEGVHRLLEDDSELRAARAERADLGGGTLEVVDGAADGSLIVLHAAMIDARLVDEDGAAWNGRLDLGADGSLRADGAEPRVAGPRPC